MEEEREVCDGNVRKNQLFCVLVSSSCQMDTNKKNRPGATKLIRERPRQKKAWQTHTSLLSRLPWDRRRRRTRKGGGEGGVEKTVGSLKPNTRLRNHPSPPPLLITHSGTKESTFREFSHGTQRRERQDRASQRDGKRRRTSLKAGERPLLSHTWEGAIEGPLYFISLTLF